MSQIAWLQQLTSGLPVIRPQAILRQKAGTAVLVFDWQIVKPESKLVR